MCQSMLVHIKHELFHYVINTHRKAILNLFKISLSITIIVFSCAQRFLFYLFYLPHHCQHLFIKHSIFLSNKVNAGCANEKFLVVKYGSLWKSLLSDVCLKFHLH